MSPYVICRVYKKDFGVSQESQISLLGNTNAGGIVSFKYLIIRKIMERNFIIMFWKSLKESYKNMQ